MPSLQTLVPPNPAPRLNIPPSSTTVKVSIIDSTSHMWNLPAAEFMSPPIKGYNYLDAPAFSFLIEHPSGRNLLFDLGVRKDWWNLAPKISSRIKDGGWKVEVEKGVSEILVENGRKLESIEGIIWSHFHWDHTGDPSLFPPTTHLIVGPGFTSAFTPGYPAKPSSSILESDYHSRPLREISSFPLTLGRFPAYDYFNDGSFYLLDSPGHTVGHMCGLARTTVGGNGSGERDSFILMGGDICHHGGEFRPTPYLPLPTSIYPNPLDHTSVLPCPGSLFAQIHPERGAASPFFVVSDLLPAKEVAHDRDRAIESIRRLEEFDCQGAGRGKGQEEGEGQREGAEGEGVNGEVDIFTVIAHDASLMGVVGFFPESANGWREKGWAERGRWAFLRDFGKAVAGEGE